ncbi:unnamed protein product [Schistosoma margrebowiei]|uniref:Uncharacterized protein n=1 Tax=Schistosoma margrebowiei TaxID=48269 RepID=A0A183ML69_9TREM|nr:unnamed protein product [Schistosoma margrebowiei]
MQLDDLYFTDDLALLSHTQRKMQEKSNSVAAVGLNIHKGKSNILRYSTACTDPVTIDGEDLKDLKPLHTWAASLMNMVGLMQM